MIFADASALVSIIAREDDADALFARLDTAERRFYSAVSRWETVAGLRRTYRVEHEIAVKQVESFTKKLAFEIASIGEREFLIAIDAARDYGRGRHPAALNMGNCFAYACAKSLGAALLYKGNDFALTDLAYAAASSATGTGNLR